MVGQQQTMQDLAGALATELSRPVTDATMLKAKYDFTLTFSREVTNANMQPRPSAGAGDGVLVAGQVNVDTPPDIFGAVQGLGLKLEQSKGPVEVVIIDHMDQRPVAN